MPQIRRRRKRKIRRLIQHEDEVAIVDPIAVKARLSSFLARWTVPAICLFLAAAVLLVFFQVLSHEFIELGDKASVYGNPMVTSGPQPGVMRRIFSLKRIDYENRGFYDPLTVISHMADWRINSQADEKSASTHHLVNMLLHGTTVILLFLTLRLVTGAIWRSAFVAALFAIHPLQVESVAWVAERGSMLCGLFFVLAIGAYVRYVYRPWSLMRYLVVMALFILGLLSQPAMVAFPFVLLLLDYWPLSRYTQPVFTNAERPLPRGFLSAFMRLFTEKIPFFAISLVAYIVTLHAQGKIKSSLDTFSLPVKISNALFSYITYIGRTFRPVGLAVFYPKGAEPKFFFEVFLAFVLLLAITLGAFLLRKKHPYLIVGWFWFVGMLAPAIGWGEGGVFAGSDRFAYLPLIGLYFIIAWGGWDLCSLLPRRGWIAAAAMGATMIALIVSARTQCSYWQDNVSLWTHARDVTAGNYMAYDNLGNALVEQTNLEDAIDDYGKAISIHPGYAEAENDLGTALSRKGDLDEAMIHYQKAIDIRPNYPEACINLGKALVEKGKPDNAIANFRKALEIRPGYADAYNYLGQALTQKGDLQKAVTEFENALKIQPYYAEAHFNLGCALSQPGELQDLPGSISHYQEALEIRPNYPEAEYSLGIAYYQNRDLDDAIIHWRKALALRPNYEDAHYDLGIALVQKGDQEDLDEALEHYQKALAIGPNYAEIYNNIATAFFRKNEFQEALDNYEKAVRIDPNFLMARNDLAWLLATCPIPSLRDGKKAVELIEKDSERPGENNPQLLRTLAAAYAESGRFQDAVKAAKQALDGIDAKNNPDIAGKLQNELKLYQAGSPFRGTP